MNKIIITGHPESCCLRIQDIMAHHGMKQPLPSLRDGLLPSGIHQALRKLQPVPELHVIAEEQGFKPLSLPPACQEMAADLLLGNQSQDLWGWADPDTIFFLEYWCAVDPDILFVLVYDSPASVLRDNAFDAGNLKDADTLIRRRLDNWAAYNGAMLRFFFQHMDRCVLIHANRLQTDSEAILNEIQSRIGATPAGCGKDIVNDLPVLDGNEDWPDADLLPTDEAIDRFLAECHMDFHTVHGGLYDELQAAAHLPLVCAEDHATCGPDLLKARILERRAFTSLIRQLTLRNHNLEQLQRRLTADHELTLLQHAQACAEMEHLLLENHSLRLELEERNKPPAPAPLTGAAERVKQHLSYRLGAIMVAKARSPLGWVSLPFALAGEALLFRGIKESRKNMHLPPIHEYADAHIAAKVKHQLSYRLGNTLVRRSRSPLGWVILPFALIRQIQVFLRSRPPEP